MSNACRFVDSATALITVTCNAPSIASPPPSRTIAPGTSTTLTVTATGTSLSYQWYRGVSGDTSQPVGTGSSRFTTPALSATEVWRRWGSSAYSLMTNNAQSGWIDPSGVAGRAYLYKIRAADADGGSTSADSNIDLASLIDFLPVVARSTTISASHWQQLHDTLNALRAAKGDSALSWTQLLPAGVPAPASGVRVRRAHLEALRQHFTNVLQALGMASPAYTNPDLAAEPEIRAIHVTELQERAQ